LATLAPRLAALKLDPGRSHGHRQRITQAMWERIDSEPPSLDSAAPSAQQ